jgi:hypothetical protein
LAAVERPESLPCCFPETLIHTLDGSLRET